MLRSTFLFALVLVGSMACDRDPAQPHGGAWQPCTDDYRCSDDTLNCLDVGGRDVSVCVPECMAGSCVAPPLNENNVSTTARCTGTGMNVGLCVVDCNTAEDCPAGMLCFYDDRFTPETGRGVCAWPPV